MSPDHRAVLILLSLAVGGQGVRWVLLAPGDAPGGIVLFGADTLGAARQRDSAARAAAPLRAGETIDLDVAPAREIARLPGVGPGLAVRIVEDRAARGPFGGLPGLDRVRGVGPALLARVGPHAAFSAAGRVVVPLAGAGAPARATGPPVDARINPNMAPANDLAGLPGIGPARARAIVAYREAHGSFASADDLAKVPGIGPATVAKLRPLLDVR